MNSVIWTMWWQGESDAPPIVKACIQSMRLNSNNHQVMVLDQYNYKKYVTLPEYIEKKRVEGKITLTHFSDIIRVNLLSKYGGLWLDSTIYVNGIIPEEVFKRKFYTIKLRQTYKGISNNQWCGFLIGGTPNNVIFERTSDFLNEYWKQEEELVDYLFLDYIFYIVFAEIKQANDDLNAVDYYPGDILDMQSKLSRTNFEISDFPIFNKLNWKEPISISNDGCLTLYQKILLNSDIADDSTNGNFNGKNIYKKIKSGQRHFRKFVDIKRIYKYGFGIQFYGFINSMFRTSNGRCACYFAKKHQKLVLKYIRRYWNF